MQATWKRSSALDEQLAVARVASRVVALEQQAIAVVTAIACFQWKAHRGPCMGRAGRGGSGPGRTSIGRAVAAGAPRVGRARRGDEVLPLALAPAASDVIGLLQHAPGHVAAPEAERQCPSQREHPEQGGIGDRHDLRRDGELVSTMKVPMATITPGTTAWRRWPLGVSPTRSRTRPPTKPARAAATTKVVVVFAALTLLGLAFLSDSLNQGILFMPNILAALLLVLIGIVLGALAGEWVE